MTLIVIDNPHKCSMLMRLQCGSKLVSAEKWFQELSGQQWLDNQCTQQQARNYHIYT